MDNDFSWIKQLPEGSPERIEAEKLLAEIVDLHEKDPLQFFEPHPEKDGKRPQLDFFEAVGTHEKSIVAAFAGNRFGKTTALVVSSLIQCMPTSSLSEKLRPFKRWDENNAPRGTFGRIVCPDRVATLEGVILPALRKWAPASVLKGDSFDKAWSKEFRTLHFKNGSWIQFMTYEMDVDKFGGAAMHFMGYDEPPPKDIRGECKMRLVDYGGFEMFACTPLKVNTGWMRRDIFKQREAPHVRVVRGSIHDNPTLSERAKREALDVHPEHERRAREFGDFLDFGGLIYPDFESCVLSKPVDLAFIRGLPDVVIAIDPGIRNAGIVWVGFDDELQAFVFNEALLQNKVAKQYAEHIRKENRRLGLDDQRVSYVCDPAARARGMTTEETVLTELQREGIYASPGQNDHEAGFGQMLIRMQHKRLHIDPRCVGLRDEADEYASREPDEGKDDSHLDPIKGNDHRLDALRYAVMQRTWNPLVEQEAAERTLGSYEYGEAPPAEVLAGSGGRDYGPMGFMS